MTLLKRILAARLENDLMFLCNLLYTSCNEHDRFAIQANPDTYREHFLFEPQLAYLFAKNIDKKARDDTRLAASKDHLWALDYAKYIDRIPHEVTRKGACATIEYAYYYAVLVDHDYHHDTLKAVIHDELYFTKYVADVMLVVGSTTCARLESTIRLAFLMEEG